MVNLAMALLIVFAPTGDEPRPAERPDPLVRAHRTAVDTSPVVNGSGTGPITGVWAALAECESGGDWQISTGLYEGGLQFHPRTWDVSARKVLGPSAPDAAYNATPAQQIAVAEEVLRTQGWMAWPACSRKLGLR